MHNDSLETLLLRHYGPTAPTPSNLEQRLLASISQQQAHHKQKHVLTQKRRSERLVTRRQILRVVALGSAGISAVGLAINGAEQLDRRFFSRTAVAHPQPAY